MKKYILSFLILGTLGSYVLFQKTSNAGALLAFSNESSESESFDDSNQNPTTTQTLDDKPKSNLESQPVVKSKTPTPSNSSNPTPDPTPVIVANPSSKYKDGTYIGLSENAYYGYVQVEAIVSGGKLSDVKILDYPNDRGTSIRINSIALPVLISEALQAQSANINTVSGASDSSGAFKMSLRSALIKAQNV